MEIHEIAASVRDMCSIEFGSQVVGDMFAKRLTEMLETRPDLGERLQAIIEESQTLASAKERANKRSKVVKVQLSPIVDTKRKRHNVRRR